MAELCLYEADRAQHVAQIIKPAIEEGSWVICDRFFDATIAYQGMARGQDLDLIARLNDAVTGGVGPDKTFLLDCPVTQGLERAVKRNQAAQDQGQDRFEREEKAFHSAVRHGYLKLADKEPERFIVIDASKDEDTVEKGILECLRPMLPKS
jgi:dTMP kinase